MRRESSRDDLKVVNQVEVFRSLQRSFEGKDRIGRALAYTSGRDGQLSESLIEIAAHLDPHGRALVPALDISLHGLRFLQKKMDRASGGREALPDLVLFNEIVPVFYEFFIHLFKSFRYYIGFLLDRQGVFWQACVFV